MSCGESYYKSVLCNFKKKYIKPITGRERPVRDFSTNYLLVLMKFYDDRIISTRGDSEEYKYMRKAYRLYYRLAAEEFINRYAHNYPRSFHRHFW